MFNEDSAQRMLQMGAENEKHRIIKAIREHVNYVVLKPIDNIEEILYSDEIIEWILTK